jgi:hypothetical protein
MRVIVVAVGLPHRGAYGLSCLLDGPFRDTWAACHTRPGLTHLMYSMLHLFSGLAFDPHAINTTKGKRCSERECVQVYVAQRKW